MILHSYPCPVCDAGALRPFPFRRADGVEIQYCLKCGSGSVPEHDLDFSEIYSPDYYLEAKRYGYSDDPPKRIGRNLLWKVFLLQEWSKTISGTLGPVQVIDVGAGLSPARALIRADGNLATWTDEDVCEFANVLSTRAYGPNARRRLDAKFSLVGLFEVLEHVEKPKEFLADVLTKIQTPGRLIIYVPNGGIDIASTSGDAWGQLHNSLEHTLYFSAGGLEHLLHGLGLGGTLFSTNVAHLAVVAVQRNGSAVTRVDYLQDLATTENIPVEALVPFACIHNVPVGSGTDSLTHLKPLTRKIKDTISGFRTEPISGGATNSPMWSYSRILDEYHWAQEVEAAQLAHTAIVSTSLPAAKPVPSFRNRPLFESKQSRLRIMYLAPKWDYGIPEQGWSYEHQNFYPTLYYSDLTERFIHFDFVDFARRHGSKAMGQQLQTLALRFEPDIIFIVFFNDEYDPPYDVLSFLGGNSDLRSTTVGWFCDDQYRFDDFTQPKAAYLNACVTTLPPTDDRYARVGLAEKVVFSNWAANPYYYQPPNKFDFRYDVSLCGLPHSDRRTLVEVLRSAGIKISTFGLGWEKSGRLTFSQLLQVFHASKINLNPSLSAHSDPGQIKGRTFEVPACGGFLLTGPMDGLSSYFDSYSEMPVYYDYADLIDKVRLFLNDDKLRMSIAHNAHLRTMREHTWEHRYREIFRHIAPRLGWS